MVPSSTPRFSADFGTGSSCRSPIWRPEGRARSTSRQNKVPGTHTSAGASKDVQALALIIDPAQARLFMVVARVHLPHVFEGSAGGTVSGGFDARSTDRHPYQSGHPWDWRVFARASPNVTPQEVMLVGGADRARQLPRQGDARGALLGDHGAPSAMARVRGCRSPLVARDSPADSGRLVRAALSHGGVAHDHLLHLLLQVPRPLPADSYWTDRAGQRDVTVDAVPPYPRQRRSDLSHIRHTSGLHDVTRRRRP